MTHSPLPGAEVLPIIGKMCMLVAGYNSIIVSVSLIQIVLRHHGTFHAMQIDLGNDILRCRIKLQRL